MTIVDNGGLGREGLVARVKNILVSPKTEWERIDGEPATVQGLYTRYICILAAIPSVATLIGTLLFGRGIPGLLVVHTSPAVAIASAVVTYLLSLVGVALVALIIDGMAPSFDGTKDRVKAFKVAAYSYTAAWVAGVLGVLPALSIVVLLLSLYSFYLLYLGLPRLMKAPQDKVVGYTVVTVLLSLIVNGVIGWIVGLVMLSTAGAGAMGLTHPTAAIPAASASAVTIGGRRIDMGRLQAAAAQMQGAANGDPNAPKPVSPEVLKTFLPETLDGGFKRTEFSASTGQAAGIGGTAAEGKYNRGDSTLTLQVTDMAAAGALASLGTAFGVSGSKQTATGYEKVGVVNGRMTTEKYDSQDHHGEYMVIAGERFMIEAEGDQISMDDLKHAVEAVNPARLESVKG